MKGLFRVFVVVAAFSAGVLLFFSTAGYRRLSAVELRFDKKWAPRIPTKALKPDEQVRDELAICEAIVRYTVSKGHFEGPVFLSIEQQDPSDTFMARLADLPVPVRKASQVDPHGYLGFLLHVGWFNWISPSEARVFWGESFFLCAGLCPDLGTYRVVKQHGRWRVLDYEIQE